ncbi:MAG: hypothetical protein ACRDT6_25245 [Micromonosporaceae bacterium]
MGETRRDDRKRGNAMSRIRRRFWAAGLIAVIALAGCQDRPAEDGGRPPVKTPSPAASSMDPKKAAEAEALDAYRGMWHAFVEAAKTSDATAPELRRYSTEDALKAIVASLYADQKRGHVTKGEPVLDPRVTKLAPAASPQEASVLDCADSGRWLKHKKSGGLVNAAPGGKRKISARVKLYGDRWKVASFAVEGLGSC